MRWILFNSKKTTQLAALFLWKSGGNFTMPYIKLMNMLYFTEKEGMLRYGYSITGDEIFSMPHGPVLSHTYNMITDDSNESVWNDWISDEDDYCVALKPKDITANNYEDKFDLLSKAEVLLVDEIYNKYKHLSTWQIRDITHDPKVCPEWHDPHDSSKPITIDDIFLSNHRTQEEANSVKKQISENDSYARLSKDLV